MENIIEEIRSALRSSSDEKTRAASQKFFKEKITCYGIKVPAAKQIGKTFFKRIATLDKAGIWVLCERLWQSGYLEETFIACDWSYAVRRQYEPEDFAVFEKWINEYVNNWASCDTLCNHTVGDFVVRYPEYVEKLKRFARSGNRWVRRAAAVSLIVPARKGLFLSDIFEIADILLRDSDDMVQKGYGWMLKAASESRREEVFAYVMKNKNLMPRTALRYAIEKMPDELKRAAMERQGINALRHL